MGPQPGFYSNQIPQKSHKIPTAPFCQPLPPSSSQPTPTLSHPQIKVPAFTLPEASGQKKMFPEEYHLIHLDIIHTKLALL